MPNKKMEKLVCEKFNQSIINQTDATTDDQYPDKPENSAKELTACKSEHTNNGFTVDSVDERPTGEEPPAYSRVVPVPEEKDVDGMIVEVGEYGRFQLIVNVMMCLLTMPTTYHLTIACFLTDRSDWKCTDNGAINSTCQQNGTLLNGTFKSEDNRRCLMRREDWTYVMGKDYSVQTTYDIVCDRDWLLSLSTTLLFIFWMAGAIVMGWFSDNYGRKRAVFVSTTAMLVLTLVSIWMPNVYLFIVCRCIIGFFGPGTFPQMFILISEIVGEKQRPAAGISIFLTGAVGCGVLGLKAYLLKNWIYLSVACSAPFLPMLLFYFFIPESIRFLRVKGRMDEAHQTLQKMAHWNKHTILAHVRLCRAEANVVTHKANPLDLFRTKRMAIKTIIQGYAWFACGMTYVGLYLAGQDLDGNLYRDYLLVAAGECIGVLIIIDLTERLGRKLSVMSMMLAGAVVCVSLVFVPKYGGYLTLRLVFGMLGKATLAASFDALHTWSVELYPANIRGEGMGFMQVCTRIGTASSPWVAKELKVIHENAPYVTMGLVSLLAFIMMFYLQETKGVKTSDTDVELENKIARKHKVDPNAAAISEL